MRGAPDFLKKFSDLHPHEIHMGLSRIKRVCRTLGNPHMRLPPVIHVAGTNGKGSTIAFMKAMLQAAGRRVHVYTSPHLLRFNERIQILGQDIDDDALAECLRAVDAANGRSPLTFFEATTAAAFLAFAKVPADVLLLETGMGGRLDATNIVTSPRVTVLTSIDMDHREFLGDSLGEIALEKAGIIKHNVPCVVAPAAPAVLSMLRRAAHEKNAPFYTLREKWDAAFPVPALQGEHQKINAALAMAALEHGGFAVPREAMATGLTTAHWRGRFESLPARSTATCEIIFDGAHNTAGARALADTLAQQPDAPTFLILGMMRRKDPRAFIRPLLELPRLYGVFTIPIAGAAEEECHPAEDLRYLVGAKARSCASLTAALAAIEQALPDVKKRAVVCGSLYLYAEACGV